jgi:hypothetical protein
VSLIKTNRTTDQVAAIGARAKDRATDAAAQAIPVGKRAGTTAVQGVRQGVQGAREWAAPRLDDAVQGAKEWAAPRLENTVQGAKEWAGPKLEDAVTGAREWVAPKLEDAAEAVTSTVAPKVSSALMSAADQVKPSPKRTGIRRLLNWRWLLGASAVAAAAGAGAAVAMRRRYTSATTEAKNATESPETGEPVTDETRGSEVTGRVTTPDV